MCTVFVLRDVLPGYPVAIAANRDEMMARPWSAPRVWPGGIVAPRDDTAGGTWLGVNERGLFCTLTNRLLEETKPDLPSRGQLCLDALGTPAIGDALSLVEHRVGVQSYNGFNFIAASAEGAEVLRHGNGGLDGGPLGVGVQVVTSSHDLNPAELMPLREAVEAAARTSASLGAFVSRVRPVLQDRTIYGERYSLCKHHELYGTRSWAVVGLREGVPPEFWFGPDKPCEADAHQVAW